MKEKQDQNRLSTSRFARKDLPSLEIAHTDSLYPSFNSGIFEKIHNYSILKLGFWFTNKYKTGFHPNKSDFLKKPDLLNINLLILKDNLIFFSIFCTFFSQFI